MIAQRDPARRVLAGWVLPRPPPSYPPHCTMHICAHLRGPAQMMERGFLLCDWSTHQMPLNQCSSCPQHPKWIILTSVDAQGGDCLICLRFVLPMAQRVNDQDLGCSCSITDNPTLNGVKGTHRVIWTY